MSNITDKVMNAETAKASSVTPGPAKSAILKEATKEALKAAVETPNDARTQEQKDLIREDICAKYDLGSGDFMDKAKASLEASAEVKEALEEKRDRPVVSVLGMLDPWVGFKHAINVNAEKCSGQATVFANARPEGRAKREAMGYKPILDAKGGEVRVGDAVLMGMPARQCEETIKRPRAAAKARRRDAVVGTFKHEAEKLGIEAEGKIEYDRNVTADPRGFVEDKPAKN